MISRVARQADLGAVLSRPVGAWLFRSYRLAHWPEPERSRDSEADAAGATVPSVLNSMTGAQFKA